MSSISKNVEESGFTLIEILITIVIIGIMAGFAVPTYNAYVIDARRTDGRVALQAAAQQLERCRTETFTYEDCNYRAASDDGYYSLNASDQTSTTYTLTATAVTGKSQSHDTPCLDIVIAQDGRGTPLECW